jgi:UDP-2-acetamido-3-amino-2,3-dideoxy-glucuronate N-acetyltransferase
MPEDEQIIVPGSVFVKRNACLYANAIVVCKGNETVVIGEGARVGAGSVVLCSVPDYEVWVGNPARRVGYLRPGLDMMEV